MQANSRGKTLVQFNKMLSNKIKILFFSTTTLSALIFPELLVAKCASNSLFLEGDLDV